MLITKHRIANLGTCGACKAQIERIDDGWVQWSTNGDRLVDWAVVHIACANDGVLYSHHHLSHFAGLLGLARITSLVSTSGTDGSIAGVLDVVGATIAAGYMGDPPTMFEQGIVGYEEQFARWRTWLGKAERPAPTA